MMMVIYCSFSETNRYTFQQGKTRARPAHTGTMRGWGTSAGRGAQPGPAVSVPENFLPRPSMGAAGGFSGYGGSAGGRGRGYNTGYYGQGTGTTSSGGAAWGDTGEARGRGAAGDGWSSRPWGAAGGPGHTPGLARHGAGIEQYAPHFAPPTLRDGYRGPLPSSGSGALRGGGMWFLRE